MPLNPRLFDHCSNRIKEIALRSLITCGAVLSLWFALTFPLIFTGGILALSCGSRLFRAIGFALQKNGFTHVRGNAPEKEISRDLKLMTWNICGIPGGFHYDHGGVIHWKGRLNSIVEKIQQEDPDVLVLQEVYDTDLAEALIDRLKDRYAHFFAHLGKTTFGCVGGCMVLSKCGVHRFSNTDFHTNDWTVKRGFANLEIKKTPEASTPFARIIGTHFRDADTPERGRVRFRQISQIVSHLGRETRPLPTFLVGDLNIERDSKEGTTLSRFLDHTYMQNEPTYTNGLMRQWNQNMGPISNERIDFISIFKEKRSLPAVKTTGVVVTESHLSQAFDSDYNTKTALSDHNAVVTTVAIG